MPALAVIVLATACARDPGISAPEAGPFATHPVILRGPWTGTVPDGGAGQALRLDLTATYDTSARYTVSGTGALAGDPLSVTGSVTGGSDRSSLRPQTTPIPETATLTLTRAAQPDTTMTCTADGSQTSVTWQWNCSVNPQPGIAFTPSKGPSIP